jgi:hypothetical protein
MTFKHIRYNFSEYNKDPNYHYFNTKFEDGLLPGSISIQETNQMDRIKAPYVMYRRVPRKFISGLQLIKKGWFWGDIISNGKSLLLVQWKSSEHLLLFIFPGFMPKSRIEFTKMFIEHWDSIDHNKKGPDLSPAPNTFGTSKEDGIK